MLSVRLNDERGSSLIEFVVLGLLLQLTLLTSGTALLAWQHDQIASESISRHALRSHLLHGLPIQETVDDLTTQFQVGSKVSWVLDCDGSCADSGSIAALRVQIGAVSATSYLPVP